MTISNIIITTIIANVWLFNHAVDANLCKDIAAPDLDTFAKDWWVIAFATPTGNLSVKCGHFCFHKDKKGGSDDKFIGDWSSGVGSKTVHHASLTGELSKDGAVIKGFKRVPEWDVKIIMCDDNQQMIWKRAKPPTNILLSVKPTGSDKVFDEYKEICDGDSFSIKNAANTDCKK